MIIDLDQQKERLVNLNKKIRLIKDDNKANKFKSLLNDIVGMSWLLGAEKFFNPIILIKTDDAINKLLEKLEKLINEEYAGQHN